MTNLVRFEEIVVGCEEIFRMRIKRAEYYLKNRYPELYAFAKNVKVGNDPNRESGLWHFEDVLKLPMHFEVSVKEYWNNHLTDGLEDIKKEFVPDLTNAEWTKGPGIGIRVNNKVYIGRYACEFYRYPLDVLVNQVIELDPEKAEEQYQRIVWLGSTERQRKLLQENQNAHDREVRAFWDEHIKPVYSEFKRVVIDITRWYFTEGWLERFGKPKCDWISIPELAKTAHYSMTEFMMESSHYFDDDFRAHLKEFEKTDDGEVCSREDQFLEALGEDYLCEFHHQMLHDFFPYFKRVFEMVNSNTKGEGYPNGDCFSGTQEESANIHCAGKLLMFAWEHIYSKK